MGRTKSDRENIRSLTKVGGSSYAVTIPRDFIRKLKWREKQKLEVILFKDRIIIRDLDS
jgi:antitoxin component of MazEF toxin-antitoxin module